MRSKIANGNAPHSFWPRVREFAVPPSMIEIATARRRAGDWAGACAAAHVDVDLNLRSVARAHGHQVAAALKDDLRHLAPDLLRWHLPRIAPNGLLRPGITIALARYDGEAAPHLVVRTPPAWADAGQRISLALWDGSSTGAAIHPHPHPDRRFRLDLHRHLWDARRSHELRTRSGADQSSTEADGPSPWWAELVGRGCAVDRWADEADILLRAEGRLAGTVGVRLGARRRLTLEIAADQGGAGWRIAGIATARRGCQAPVLPDAATWVLPDLRLLRAGLIEAERLHPLVAAALAPDHRSTVVVPPDRSGRPRWVECRGERHRIGVVDGVLTALDHDPGELRREGALAALNGPPLPCLRAIDEAHRHPECLPDVRARLDHGDLVGALAVVEELLGPDAALRPGALRDDLETVAQRRISHGLFRAGLTASGASAARPDRRRVRDRGDRAGRAHPRHTIFR